MIGLLIVKIERSVIYTVICVMIGKAMVVAILLSPYIILGANVGARNVASYVTLNAIAKLLLVGAVVYFLGVIIGCFLGEKTIEATKT